MFHRSAHSRASGPPGDRSPNGRRLARAAAVLVLALGLVGLTVLPASAHHPEIVPRADCDGQVSWTSTAWMTGDPRARHNDDVRIQRSVDGGAWTEIARGAYTAGNGYAFTGSFSDVAAGTTVRLRAYAADNWGTDGYDVAGRQYSGESTVSWPGNCQPPTAPAPTADLSVDCDGFVVRLGNAQGTADAVFTVVGPDGTSQDVTVPAGQQAAPLTFPVTEDQERTVRVLVDGQEIASKTYTADCVPPVAPAPGATLGVDCADGFVATLTNTGGTAPAVFTLTRPDGSTEQVTVPAGGGPVTRSYPVIEDQAQTMTVTSPGLTDVVASLTAEQADCVVEPPATPAPTAALSVDCNGFVVRLANTGGAADAVFTVVGPDGTSQDVTVPAGQQAAPLTFPVTEDVARTVRVLSGGQELDSVTYTADCATPPVTPPTPPVTPPTPPSTPPTTPSAAAPQASLDVDCTGFDVSLSNEDGTADAVFDVTGPGGNDREVTVPSGEEVSLTFPVTEDEERSVSVSYDGEQIASRSYTADCIKGEEVNRPPVSIPPTVAGVEAVAPQSGTLPDTGAPSHQWLSLSGLLLVALGGALLASRRTQRG